LRDAGESEGRRVLSEEIVRLLIEDQGFGHTMGFAYKDTARQYGDGSKTLMHLGSFNTFFWYETRRGTPLLGVFLAQRMTYASKRIDGREIIFKVLTPAVETAVFSALNSDPA
jgi:hypothetical protein